MLDATDVAELQVTILEIRNRLRSQQESLDRMVELMTEMTELLDSRSQREK